MAAIKVNLLPYKQRWFMVRQRMAWWLTTGSMIVGAGYAVLLLVLLTWELVMEGQLKAALARIDQTKGEVEALAGRESQQVLVKAKLAKVTELTRQVGMTQALKAIGQLWAPGVEWREIAMKSDGGIEVTGSSSDVVAVGETLEKIEENPVRADFTKVTLQSLTKGSNGQYSLTLNLVKAKL